MQVYDMETSYLQDPSQCGNVLKGFEGFLSSSKNTALYGHTKIFFASTLYLSIRDDLFSFVILTDMFSDFLLHDPPHQDF